MTLFKVFLSSCKLFKIYNTKKTMKKRNLFVVAAVFCSVVSGAQTLPYQNPNLSAKERAADLCSRLTLEEKAKLMLDQSEAIPRLGIPGFAWWSEALHGVGRNGYCTVFPSCIGMAASFDDVLLERIYTAVSDEHVQRIRHRERRAAWAVIRAFRSGLQT